MQRLAALPASLLVLAALGLAAGCNGGSATVKGNVTDSGGSQAQQLRLGGSGTVSGSTQVRVSSLGGSGALTTVATTTLAADGSYSLSVPANSTQLVVQSLDASGNVTASGIVETTGAAGATTTLGPIDTESSVEAQVFISMVTKGTAVADINTIDLRQRINQNVAAAVNASSDMQNRIDALADATLSAQATQVKLYAQDGVNVSQSDLFNAELTAAVSLDSALAASSSTAYTDFSAAIDAALKAKGIADKARAQATSGGEASFRGTVKARLSVSDSATADAAFRASSVLEAHAVTTSANAILAAGAVSAGATNSASSAAQVLEAAVASASTAADASAAFSAYASAMLSTDASTGVLGQTVGVNASTEDTLNGSVMVATNASGTLDTALNAVVSTSLSVSNVIDYNLVATDVTAGYAALDTTLNTQVALLSTFGAQAQVAVDLMVVVRGSGHLASL